MDHRFLPKKMFKFTSVYVWSWCIVTMRDRYVCVCVRAYTHTHLHVLSTSASITEQVKKKWKITDKILKYFHCCDNGNIFKSYQWTLHILHHVKEWHCTAKVVKITVNLYCVNVLEVHNTKTQWLSRSARNMRVVREYWDHHWRPIWIILSTATGWLLTGGWVSG